MFANSLSNPLSRAAYLAHAAAARAHFPTFVTNGLRRFVRGHFDDGTMALEIRPSTWDAWTAHPGHEPETHRWISEYCAGRDGSAGVMLDVGAYIGSFSLRYRSRFSAIHAFEASSANYRALERNAALNDGTFVPHHAAIADGDGSIRLYLDTPDTNSIYGTGAYEEVRIIRLDDWWQAERRPNVDLIKIDVEGAEVDVIASASRLLQTGPVVIAEANDAKHERDVTEAMEAHGYRLARILDRANLLFERAATTND